MTTYTVTLAPASIRDIDGCDSDAAVDKIFEAARDAAEQFAAENEISITVIEHPYPNALEKTVRVGYDIPEDLEDRIEVMEVADEIEDEIDRAITRAIEAGDWLDEDAA